MAALATSQLLQGALFDRSQRASMIPIIIFDFVGTLVDYSIVDRYTITIIRTTSVKLMERQLVMSSMH